MVSAIAIIDTPRSSPRNAATAPIHAAAPARNLANISPSAASTTGPSPGPTTPEVLLVECSSRFNRKERIRKVFERKLAWVHFILAAVRAAPTNRYRRYEFRPLAPTEYRRCL